MINDGKNKNHFRCIIIALLKITNYVKTYFSLKLPTSTIRKKKIMFEQLIFTLNHCSNSNRYNNFN